MYKMNIPELDQFFRLSSTALKTKLNIQSSKGKHTHTHTQL